MTQSHVIVIGTAHLLHMWALCYITALLLCIVCTFVSRIGLLLMGSLLLSASFNTCVTLLASKFREYYFLQAGIVAAFDDVITEFLSAAPEERSSIYSKGEAEAAKLEGKAAG